MMKVILLCLFGFVKRKILILFLLFCSALFSQNEFRLPEGKKNNRVRFKLANDLIVIPVMVNGVELSFILDTGVGSTIIFSVDNRSSLELKNATKIHLKGLGSDSPVEAVRSTGNELKIGKAVSANHKIYLVLDESINFSSLMGFPVHGIIGYDFFKDLILEISYSKRVIKINAPKEYVYDICEKCYQTDIIFKNRKKRPHMAVRYKSGAKYVDVELLIDSGSGSSLWLFENKEKGIQIDNDSFRDFLGRGFSGEVYGRKTRVDELLIGNFKMEKVTASFPDSLYIKEISKNNRQGSLGASVLRRFNLIVDYTNQKITFKKNGFFNRPFYYNMSGLTVEHIGFSSEKDYKEQDRVYLGLNKMVSKKTFQMTNNLVLLPKYKISEVRVDSPASRAGLQKGDIILEVNGRKAYEYKLSDLNELFFYGEGKRVVVIIERLGVRIKYQFYLEKVI